MRTQRALFLALACTACGDPANGKTSDVTRVRDNLKKVSSPRSSACRKLATLLLARGAAAAFNAPNLRSEGKAKVFRRASLPRMLPDPVLPQVDVQAALDAASQVDVQAALDAAAPVLKSAADTVGSVASASAPVLSGAAAVGGTVAKGLIPVIKKGVEVTAPVLQEGVKAAVPLAQEGLKVAGQAINDGQLSEETVASLSSAATLPTAEALSEFGASPLGVALQNFAPYFVGVVLVYLATQAAISKIVEVVQPLVLPTVGVVALGLGLQAGFSFGLIQLPDWIVLLPQRVGYATILALALYVYIKLDIPKPLETAAAALPVDREASAPSQTDEAPSKTASETVATASAVEKVVSPADGAASAPSQIDEATSKAASETDATASVVEKVVSTADGVDEGTGTAASEANGMASNSK